MAVAFRAAGSGSGSGSVTLNDPAGTATGDILIAEIVAGDPPASVPAGWSLLTGTATIAVATWVYYYVVGTPAGSHTWTWGGGGGTSARGVIAAYSGADTGAPFDASVMTFQQVSPAITSFSVPAITTAHAGSMVIGGLRASGSVTVTPPGVLTERIEFGAQPVEHASAIQVSSGSSGTLTWTTSGASGGFAWATALLESGVGGTVFATSIATAESVPSPTVSGGTAVAPVSIGTFAAVPVATLIGTLAPDSIASLESVGTLTIQDTLEPRDVLYTWLIDQRARGITFTFESTQALATLDVREIEVFNRPTGRQ